MDYREIEQLSETVKKENLFVQQIKDEMEKLVVGQNHLIESVIISFLAGGHILVEGLPGLAKTFTVRAFAGAVNCEFRRIQFTPDLLPSDLTGTRIFDPGKADFFTKKGPVFTSLLLADEINRAPAKVQSALLQAMEEKQVTIGDETFPLNDPFMVLATENPVEQEGTYPLPEAQLDRFFMKVPVDYPEPDEEKKILAGYSAISTGHTEPVFYPENLGRIRSLIDSIYIDEKLMDYIVAVAGETRKPSSSILKKYIEFGVSPRASISLMKAARCRAFISGRGFVTPDDIKAVGADVLRHRIILSYEAEADGRTPDDIVKAVFDAVQVP